MSQNFDFKTEPYLSKVIHLSDDNLDKQISGKLCKVIELPVDFPIGTTSSLILEGDEVILLRYPNFRAIVELLPPNIAQNEYIKLIVPLLKSGCTLWKLVYKGNFGELLGYAITENF